MMQMLWVLGLKTPTHCTILDCSWQKLTVKTTPPPVSKFGQFQKFRTKFSQCNPCYELQVYKPTTPNTVWNYKWIKAKPCLLFCCISKAQEQCRMDDLTSWCFCFFSIVLHSHSLHTQNWYCTAWHRFGTQIVLDHLAQCDMWWTCKIANFKPTWLQTFRKMTWPIKSVLNWLTITIVLYAKCWHFDI